MQSPGHQPFTYYYKPTPLSEEKILLELKIKEIFHASKEVYGARKIKRALAAEGITASRQHIRRIMDKLGLVSVYTKAQYKHYDRASDDQRTTPNAINREFQHRGPLEAVVSDLTYVRIPGQWAYVCLITDLYNREIIGYSCGPYKKTLIWSKRLPISFPPLWIRSKSSIQTEEESSTTNSSILYLSTITSGDP